MRSEGSGIDEWLKELSPSGELRKWFAHDPEKWDEFKRRYLKELSSPDKQALLEHVGRAAVKENITLVYGARDTEHNNARVLEELLGKQQLK